MNQLRDVKIKKDQDGNYENIRVTFGPHYFIEINAGDNKTTFVLGVTHHDFRADASEIDGELERFINEVRSNHPNNLID